MEAESSYLRQPDRTTLVAHSLGSGMGRTRKVRILTSPGRSHSETPSSETGGDVDEGSVPPPPGAPDGADGDETRQARREAAPRPETIVAFEFNNGNKASFLAAADGDLILTESTNLHGAENLIFSPRDELTPLDVFLSLSTRETPIPMALIERYPAKYLDLKAGSREVVEKLSGPIQVDVDQLGIAVSPQFGPSSGSGSCGADGAQSFEDNHCLTIELGNHCPIDFCDSHHPSDDNELWATLTRNSYQGGWERRWNSYERTAACGTTVSVWHEYWAWWLGFGWGWVVKHHYQVPANEVHHSWIWGSSKRYRRVDRVRTGGSGGMRAYTKFTNNGNWC